MAKSKFILEVTEYPERGLTCLNLIEKCGAVRQGRMHGYLQPDKAEQIVKLWEGKFKVERTTRNYPPPIEVSPAAGECIRQTEMFTAAARHEE